MDADGSRCQLALPPFHLRPVVVAEEVQESVDERPPPVGSNDLRAEDDVS